MEVGGECGEAGRLWPGSVICGQCRSLKTTLLDVTVREAQSSDPQRKGTRANNNQGKHVSTPQGFLEPRRGGGGSGFPGSTGCGG